MSRRTSEVLSADGFLRISAEVLLAFALVSVAYLVAVEPVLQSLAPDVYAERGLDYSRTDLPDTASEVTHLLLSLAVVGPFFYWRLYRTELGDGLRTALRERE